MSKFTKKAIMNSFMKLLNTTSFDNITVKDIVADCGINRNTFYYNFDDIYALVDEILQSEINRIAEEHRPYRSWKVSLSYAAEFALQNKEAVFHLHNSSKRLQLEKYLQRVIYDVVIDFVNIKSEGSCICDEDKNFIAVFYTCALVGLINKWLDDGMKGELSDVIDKTSMLFDLNIEQAIRAVSECKREQGKTQS